MLEPRELDNRQLNPRLGGCAAKKQIPISSIMHSISPDDALLLKERLLSEFNCVEATVSETTSVIGSHTGPGLMGIAFHPAG